MQTVIQMLTAVNTNANNFGKNHGVRVFLQTETVLTQQSKSNRMN